MKWKTPSTLVLGGVGLSLGASAVNSIPASATSASVNKGLGNAGNFFPMIGTLGGATMAFKQLKQLKEVK